MASRPTGGCPVQHRPVFEEKKEELLTPKVKTCDIAAFPIKKEFVERYESVKLKKGTYKDVRTKYSYYEVLIESRDEEDIKNISGTVIEVKMKQGTSPNDIYKESMLLFINKTNLTEEEVKDTYFRYLQRFGIETVYKYMKNTLHLEKFQSRDFESIKKLIAITFFSAAYFYLTKRQVLENPVLEKRIFQICQLGRGKGETGPIHLQKGLESMINHFLVSNWQKEYDVSDEELKEIMEYFGYGWVFKKC